MLKSLLRPKFSGHVVYVHNLSNFDGIFLFNALADITRENKTIKIEPLLREGNIINIKINFGGNNGKYNLNIRDSYLLLPISLKKLAIQFQVEHAKTIFPYNFMNDRFNKEINLNYIGNIPEIKFFSNSASSSNIETKEVADKYTEFLSDYLSTQTEPSNPSLISN